MLFAALLSNAVDPASNGNINNNWQPVNDLSVQLFLPLIFLLVIIAAGYLIMRFLRPNFRKGKNLETIEAMLINQTSSIRLVRVGKKFFLLGVTKDRISFLAEIDENGIDNDYTTVDGTRAPDLLGQIKGIFGNRGKDDE